MKRVYSGEEDVLYALLEAMKESSKCDSLVMKIYRVGQITTCWLVCVRAHV